MWELLFTWRLRLALEPRGSRKKLRTQRGRHKGIARRCKQVRRLLPLRQWLLVPVIIHAKKQAGWLRGAVVEWLLPYLGLSGTRKL